MLIILIDGHTDFNHENNKCSIHFRNCSSNAHQIRCEDSPTKGIFCQSSDLALHSLSQLRLELDNVVTCGIIAVSRTINIEPMTFKFGMNIDLCTAYFIVYYHARLNDLDLDARVGKCKQKSAFSYLDN